MNQSERRTILIQVLLKEHPEYQELRIPADADTQRQLLRGLLNIREPRRIGTDFLQIQDAYLQEETAAKGITDAADLMPLQPGLYLWQGDIMRKRVLPPEDTPSANLSAAAAVGCSTPPSTPRNTVTATGAAIRPTIGDSGNTAKCAVRIWSASAAVKNSHPNVQMPAIAAMPVGKKTIENVLRMLQVVKMSTSFSVTLQGLLKIRLPR